MTPRTRTVCALIAGAVALAGCGSSKSPSPAPPGPEQTGGRGGEAGMAGTGGGGPDAAEPGSGGSGIDAATGGSDGGEPDAAPGEGGAPLPPPPLQPEQPLPPCKRTVPVATIAELGAAAGAAEPGDCVVMADGKYAFPDLIGKVGTEAAPIVFKAANRGKAVVNTRIAVVQSAHVVIEGITYTGGSSIMFLDSQHCRLTRIRYLPFTQGSSDWVVISGTSHHNRIDHNDFGPRTVIGNVIMLSGAGPQIVQHNRIDHNHFHDILGGGGNGWETIRMGLSSWGQSQAFNVVELNLFRAATGDPETISVKSSDNIIRYNTYRATNGEITLRHGNRTLVYGNFMLGDGLAAARGMRVLGADHRIFNNYIESIGATAGILLRGGSNDSTTGNGTDFYRVYRTQVVNNTVVGGRGIAVGSTDMPPVDCVVANNVVQHTSGEGIANLGQGTRLEGNVVHAMGGTQLPLDGVRLIDPLLIRIDNVFRPMAGSPLIDAAVGSYDYVTDDMDGHLRDKVLDKVDIGADEVAAGMITRRALTEADVGPDAP